MRNGDFAIFILTHGRPDSVVTLATLRRSGYTGRVFLVIDDEDKTGPEYVERFGRENVIVFSKEEIGKTFDQGDNFGDRRTITYARNACWPIAESLGVKYFMQLDDDYTTLQHRFDENGWYSYAPIKRFDAVLDALIDFYKKTPALSVAIAQGGGLYRRGGF